MAQESHTYGIEKQKWNALANMEQNVGRKV